MDGGTLLQMNGKRPLSLPSTAVKLHPSATAGSAAASPPLPSWRIFHDPNLLPIDHPSLLPLQSCRSLRQLLQAQSHLITTGLFAHPFAASRILKSAASVGPLSYTLVLLRHIPRPDAVCVNTALTAACCSRNPLSAVALYFEMLAAGFVPNTYTFPPLAKACTRAVSDSAGAKCHAQAVKHGATAVTPVSNALLHMYASCGLVYQARAMFDKMSQRDVVSWNSMIDGYVKSGDMGWASKLFSEMPVRNVVSWNSMIAGYLRQSRPARGLRLFREMREAGLRGTETTMVGVVTVCGRLRLRREGVSVHGYFVRNFVGENLIFGTALVDMYSRCGRANVAQRVFDGMSERNVVSWNAMVLGHCIHGSPEDGLLLFNRMVGEGGKSKDDGGADENLRIEHVGIRPDEVTFIGVLCACARAGLLTEGKQYFNQITNLYNLTPSFAHYWCMANLYGALGLVKEAENVLRVMPKETDSSLLSNLLGLSRFRGDVELGERIAKRLIELEPKNCSRYALLWNVYAAAGQWEDAHKVKELMKERRVRVMDGYDLFSLKEVVHNFKVGDKTHPEIEQITMVLDDLVAILS